MFALNLLQLLTKSIEEGPEEELESSKYNSPEEDNYYLLVCCGSVLLLGLEIICSYNQYNCPGIITSLLLVANSWLRRVEKRKELTRKVEVNTQEHSLTLA